MPENQRSEDSKKYLEHLEWLILLHDLPNTTQALLDQLTGAQDLTAKIRDQLDKIDTLRIQGMLNAERQCHKLHSRPYGWTLSITILIQSIKYWRYSWTCKQGCPYHERILHWLGRALPELPSSEDMSENEIREQLKKYKERLRRQLGDPNQCQTWLEELVEAQAKDYKTMPKK